MNKRKIKKKEYTIEESPFYNKYMKMRISLTELKPDESEDIVLARKRHFKQDEYIKFIITNEFDIHEYHQLSGMAKTLLFYIFYFCIEYNSPTFRLKAVSASEALKVDTSIIFRVIKELSDIKYISRTSTREVYWINHNKFYKGNYITDKFLKQKQ